MSVSQEDFRGGCESWQPMSSDVTLDEHSKVVHICNPSASRNFTLPDARTLQPGQRYIVLNLAGSGNTVAVKDNAGTTIYTLATGGGCMVALADNTTQAGQWFRFDGVQGT